MLLYKDGCSQREEIPRVRGAFKRSDYTPLKDFLRARALVVAVREEKMVVKDVEKKERKRKKKEKKRKEEEEEEEKEDSPPDTAKKF
ncbi:hypothetical protein HZH68_003465 [Vespula germanica]|uniref:Uncharacterized protein n=1 Tax=Vespula germanica TaxID=30212 RepID=A0A834NPE4_VESGE|nr:hypothetical protein HZH68_003465 [Vespula germanica]